MIGTMRDDDIELLEKVVCYQGYFRIERYHVRHRLFNGQWSRSFTREIFERGHAAAVLPYDPVRDEVILIEQFRAGALSAPGGPWLLEIVAGMIESGEVADDVVKRESIEEANCVVTDLIPLYDYLVSPGGTSERIALFCGRTDTSQAGGIYGVPGEDEDIKVHVVGWEAAMRLLRSGKVNSASAIIALQWLALNRKQVIDAWKVA